MSFVIPSEWNLRWPFTAVGLVFSIIFAFLSLGIIPACGNGTGILIIAAFGFYGVGLLFWPAIAFLLADLKTILAKALVLVLLACHYGFLYAYLNHGGLEERQRIAETFAIYPRYMLPPTILYIMAHVLIWALLLRGVVFSRTARHNKSLDASGGSVFRN